jgi:hypothetical protein
MAGFVYRDWIKHHDDDSHHKNPEPDPEPNNELSPGEKKKFDIAYDALKKEAEHLYSEIDNVVESQYQKFDPNKNVVTKIFGYYGSPGYVFMQFKFPYDLVITLAISKDSQGYANVRLFAIPNWPNFLREAHIKSQDYFIGNFDRDFKLENLKINNISFPDYITPILKMAVAKAALQSNFGTATYEHPTTNNLSVMFQKQGRIYGSTTIQFEIAAAPGGFLTVTYKGEEAGVGTVDDLIAFILARIDTKSKLTRDALMVLDRLLDVLLETTGGNERHCI